MDLVLSILRIVSNRRTNTARYNESRSKDRPFPMFVFAGLALALSSLNSCSPDAVSSLREAPDELNDPTYLGVDDYVTLGEIASHASLSGEGWSGHSWPTQEAGISVRWQTQGHSGGTLSEYLYPLHSERSIRSLSQRKLDRLSPAEKFDLAMGWFDFPTTKAEREEAKAVRDEFGHVPSWFGLCHGWAAASIMEDEPGYLASVPLPGNFRGKRIKFYASDLKALLTKFYADTTMETVYVGGRCDERRIVRDANRRVISPECRDTNPASFHMVLNENIAKRNRSVIADLSHGGEVWNYPISEYSFRYTNKRRLDRSIYQYAAPGTKYLINVRAVIYHVAGHRPRLSPVRPVIKSRSYSYTLELDGNDGILGGEWIGDARPDFLWRFADGFSPGNETDGTLIPYREIQRLVQISRRQQDPGDQIDEDSDEDDYDDTRPGPWDDL